MVRLPKSYILLCCLAASPAQAANLRPYSMISNDTVRLGDLFDDLGTTPDRVLGKAPAPGAKITVASPQLAAIARDFNVDWRPATGAEQAVIERRGDTVSPSKIDAALRQALQNAGAAESLEIEAPALQPIMVPAGLLATPEISGLSYDPRSGHFTALVTVHLPGAPDLAQRISGTAYAVVNVAVASHRLANNSVVAPGDVVEAPVRATRLHGASAILPSSAVGMTLRHDVAEGQPLTVADLARQILVQHGQLVAMVLNSGGIVVTATGRAAQAGSLGDIIRIENPSSHVMVDAQVTGPAEVSVAPRNRPASLAAAQ